MTVPEIYNKWKEQWKKEEFRSFDLHRFPEIAYNIRESERVWDDKDIETFSRYLRDKEKKRFVANLFNIQKQIPEQLFEAFIDAAINETDPSANQDYIKPCLRVFGFVKVIELLDLRFLYGDNKIRKGVSNAYYWAKSPLVNIVEDGKPSRITGHISKWNGLYYDTYDWNNDSYYEMTESEITKFKEEIHQMKVKKRKLFIEEFLNSNDTNTRNDIKLLLPNELDSFSQENQALAKIYLQEINQFKE